MHESKNACEAALPDFRQILERQAAFDQVYRNLEHYQTTRVKLEKCNHGAALRDAAFGAEADARILIALALESLNESADSGTLAELQPAKGRTGTADLHVGLTEGKKFFQNDERFHSFDTRFFDRAQELLKSYHVRAEHSELGYRISFVDPSGNSHAQLVTFGSLPGSAARVSLEQFFGPSGPVLGPTNVFRDSGSDCRHQAQELPLGGSSVVSAYELMLTGFTQLRDSMYSHARTVAQYGHAHATAEDLILAFGIAALVVGIASAFGGQQLYNSCKQINLPDVLCKGAAALLIVAGLVLTGIGIKVLGGALLVLIGGGNPPPQGGPQPPGPPANVNMPV
jgi:hypothetical protein